MLRPDTRFADAGFGRVAYQVVGEGPIDVLVSHNQLWPIDLMWDQPAFVAALDRLSSFCRHIWFDPRGRGASDPLQATSQPLEEDIVQDMLAVLDDLAISQAVLLDVAIGYSSLLFAATHPERTSAVAIVNGCARWSEAPGYSEGRPLQSLDVATTRAISDWGTGDAGATFLAPSLAANKEFCAWLARGQRLTTRPEHAEQRMRRAAQADKRGVLPLVVAPALVVHRRDDRFVPVALGRYLAAHLPNAQYVELPGADHLFFAGDTEGLLDVVEQFVTGEQPRAIATRVLATVLFTDIVASTEQAARLGDNKWTELLTQHDIVVAREIARHRGRQVNPTGDGILATFDGPARGVRCAQAIIDAVRPLGLEVRAGLHTGEIELRGQDIGGIAVHIGQRVSSLAGPGQIYVSRTVTDLVVGSGLEFDSRGTHSLKGVPGRWPIFAVTPTPT